MIVFEGEEKQAQDLEVSHTTIEELFKSQPRKVPVSEPHRCQPIRESDQALDSIFDIDSREDLDEFKAGFQKIVQCVKELEGSLKKGCEAVSSCIKGKVRDVQKKIAKEKAAVEKLQVKQASKSAEDIAQTVLGKNKT